MNEREHEKFEKCPRCRGSGCYDCGGYGYVTETEADHLIAEDACADD